MMTVGSFGVYMQQIKAQIKDKSEDIVKLVGSVLPGDILEIPCHNLKTGKEEKARFRVVDVDKDRVLMSVVRN